VSLKRDQPYSRCFHTGLWTKLQEIDADEFNGVSNLHHGRSDQDDVCTQEVNQAAPAFCNEHHGFFLDDFNDFYPYPYCGASTPTGDGTMVAGSTRAGRSILRLLGLPGTRRLLN
jgi:hypothetical protein